MLETNTSKQAENLTLHHHLEPAMQHDSDQISVLTLNVWGLNIISKQRVPRIKAISTQLLSGPSYDFVCLQEIWYESKDWRFLKQALVSRYPYAKFFYSGAFGSGLAILSRWAIEETRTHPYSLNGLPLHVHHGDWFVGKACGSITVRHPRLGLLDVWNTHFVAAGGEDCAESFRAHRITQAYELATNARNSATRGRHVIAVGDLNSTPPSLCIALLRNIGGLFDSFADSHPRLDPLATSLESSSEGSRPDPRRAISELGVTCDSPLNTWTHGKPLDERATRGAGKRLDYILFRGPVPFAETGDAQLAYAPQRSSASNRGRLQCTASSVVFTDMPPNLSCSYSDHFGVESIFRILDAPHESVDAGADVLHAETLSKALTALAGGFVLARATQRSHYYAFAAALALAVILIVASVFQPLGGVNPVFVLLAVVAGWAGTTMLYSALVWGEWEQRKSFAHTLSSCY